MHRCLFDPKSVLNYLSWAAKVPISCAMIVQGHLKNFKEEIQELGTKILQAALALHDRVTSTFRKTAVNFHYEYVSLLDMALCSPACLSAACWGRLQSLPPNQMLVTPNFFVCLQVYGAPSSKCVPGLADEHTGCSEHTHQVGQAVAT